MLKDLRGIKHYSQLLNRLSRHPEEAEILGFNTKMTRQSMSVFTLGKLTQEIEDLIVVAVDHIRDKAKETGKLLDVYFLDESGTYKGKSTRTIERRKSEKSGEVVRVLKREIFPNLDFPLKSKAKYDKMHFLDLLAYVAYENVCANQGSKLMKEDANFNGRVPHSRTLMGYLKLLDKREIELMFINSFEKVFKIAKMQGFFNREVDVAIDFTDWLYYGDKNDLGVMEGQTKQGTSHRFRFATIKIVEKNNDFVLMALPVFKFSDRREVAKRLINYANSKVNVRYFYVDREFFSSTFISLFEELGIKYIMPAIKNEKVVKLIENRKSDFIAYTFTGTARKYDAKMTLVVRKDEEGKDVCFATNVPILRLVWSNLFELYGKRWGIETAYRVAKHEFRPNTTSKNHKIRLYYFLFSSLLYNIWVIVNSIVSVYLFREVVDYRVITAKLFMKKFYQAYTETIT
ncbi:MAG: transposase [Candidatus Aenigmarchaeota archaeon]|nr:transposase [Candidatus Aenigmarchaeota archaeon]